MTRYTIPSPAARDAVCTTEWSWCRWTKDLPHGGFERPGFGGGCAPKRYDFADLVPALREMRRGGLTGIPLARLMDCASDIAPGVRLSDGADAQAERLIACLSPEEVERFERVKKWAHAGAVYSLWGKLHLIDLPRHLANLILIPAVADYVLSGRRRQTFPTTRDQFGDLIAQHVIANASKPEIEALSANGVEYV